MPRILHDDTESSALGLTVAAFIFDEAGRLLLVKKNYGKRRYGPPGGRMEAGENPKDAVIREVLEETTVTVRVQELIGIYHFVPAGRDPWFSFTFRCEINHGRPRVPDTGEIAELGWFEQAELPSPLTNLATHAIRDAVSGSCGLVRDTIYLR